MRIRFISKNPNKIEEARSILHPAGIEVVPVEIAIDEIQSTDMNLLVADKCAKAFERIGRPLFVEHTGLHIRAMGGFPGGLTQVFWDTVGADRVCELFGNGADLSVTATTIIGYCDGRRIHQFSGQIEGTIAPSPRGNRTFQWDCIFVPSGETETFAEMGDARKNAISMRRLALDEMARHLGKYDA